MQLNEMIIRRNPYDFNHQGVAAKSIGGSIKFQGERGHEVNLILTHDHINKILAVVAESMVETTRELANDLTANIIEQAASLPAIGVEA